MPYCELVDSTETKPEKYFYARHSLSYYAFIFFASNPEGWKIKAKDLFNSQINCFFSLPLGMRQRKRSSRLYDPTLARMLNADPFIADATSAQDFNRYSYVRNNPLKYTDPSGYMVSGGMGYYDRKISAQTRWISEGREWWNKTLDFGYHRGDYALGGGGFGGTNAFFYGGSNLMLGIGSVEDGFLGDGFVSNPVIDYYSTGGENIIKHNGQWGVWKTFAWREGSTIPIIDSNGFWKGINLFTFCYAHVFYKYNHSSKSCSNTSAESIFGLGLSLSSEIIYSNHTGRWLATNGKFYSTNYYGNQYTSLQKYARRYSNSLKWIGRFVGLLNARHIWEQRENGQIDDYQFWIEQGSNAFVTFGGINGAAWGIGWEIGRWITNTNGYQQFKYNLWN